MKTFFRKLHRWLGLLMAVQIIAWMASGLYFSIFPIDEIRGAHLTRAPEPLDAGQLTGMGSPAQVMRLLNRQFPGDWSLSSLKLTMVAGQAFWRAAGSSENQGFTRLVEADEQIKESILYELLRFAFYYYIKESYKIINLIQN
jgi:hypothetical protein